MEAGILLEDSSEVDAFLEEVGLPVCEERQLLLSRSLSRKKMAKIHINEALTTLQNLKALCGYWINYHGASEPRKLFASATIGDAGCHGGLDGQLGEYSWPLRNGRTLAKIQELVTQEALSPDERLPIQLARSRG